MFYSNGLFQNIFAKRENEERIRLMITKIKKVKPTVNTKCPESFNFFKEHFKNPKITQNISKSMKIIFI